jgi:hypothetical protein
LTVWGSRIKDRLDGLEVTISNSLTIAGPGAAKLFVSGNRSVQVFNISARVTVTISGLTVENGSSSVGGGIRNSGPGTVTITASTLSGNTTFTLGGGIDNTGGSVTVTNSTIFGITAQIGGGTWGEVTFGATIVAGNSASSGPNCAADIRTSVGYNLTDDPTGGYYLAASDGGCSRSTLRSWVRREAPP